MQKNDDFLTNEPLKEASGENGLLENDALTEEILTDEMLEEAVGGYNFTKEQQALIRRNICPFCEKQIKGLGIGLRRHPTELLVMARHLKECPKKP